jgi:twitching motility protein PilT
MVKAYGVPDVPGVDDAPAIAETAAMAAASDAVDVPASPHAAGQSVRIPIETPVPPAPVAIEPALDIPAAAELPPPLAPAATAAPLDVASAEPEIAPERAPVAPPHAPAAAAQEDQRSAVVLPISRSPIRPEPPAYAPAAALAPLEHMLRVAAARGASTVYVVAQSKPMIRVDGEISLLDSEPAFSAGDVERLVMDLAPARGRDVQAGAVEWMSDVPEVGRVRCVTFRDHRGPGVIFRMIPPRAISVDQLGLPTEVQALCAQPDGLVLVAGARASGKSTLLSAFIDLINRTRSDHVISIESQINFVHESRKSFVSQREVRGDAEAAAAAVRSAFREDPDVLVIEDLRTAEIVSVALEAAESGRLVLGSLSAPSTVAAIERLVELFSPERRAQVQTALAGSLRGVVAQALLRKMKGGRIAAREVLLNTPAVASLILEGRTFQLPVALDAGRRHGMVPLTDSLAALVREGTVHVAEAYRKALDREALLAVLKRDGIDTSFAERLA